MAEGGIMAQGPGGTPLRAICSELAIPGFGPLILVGADAGGQAVECPPRHALQAAEVLLEHAIRLQPRLGYEPDVRGWAGSLLARLLDGVGGALSYVIAEQEAVVLRRIIDKLADEKAAEIALGIRQAAKQSALAEVRNLVARLLDICAEPSADVRAMALAAIRGEIATAMADIEKRAGW